MMSLKLFLVGFCLCSVGIEFTSSYPNYQDEVPNGNRVPNPCDTSTTWQGLGHEDSEGGGARNPFGRAFFDNGKKWTKALCEADSDGDGKSNGAELGDPSCVWTKGAQPAVTDQTKLSHPGVCEPLDSPSCQQKNTFLKSCAALGLTTPSTSSWCPEINGADVQTLTFRFDKAKLSTEETQYMCQLFDVPSEEDYEIIAWEPIIDNRAILHHMVVFACENLPPNVDITNFTMPEPQKCRMTPALCGSMVIVWAYGIPGQCFSKEFGAPFGKTSFNKMILQHHYNNDARLPGFVDSSGIKIYYTPKKRPQNKGLIAFGDFYLRVPPRTSNFEVTSTLSSDCSKYIFQPEQNYYLVSLLVHIHKQGSYGRLILNKKKAGYSIVLVDEALTYDRPKTAIWAGDHQVLMEPGDELTLTCGYNTLNKKDWTFFGSQTADEMCYYFIDVYPRPRSTNFIMPASMGDIDFCEEYPTVPGQPWAVRGCDYTKFHARLGNTFGAPAPMLSNATRGLLDACACDDVYPAKGCTLACYNSMTALNLMNDPCLADDAVFQIGMRPFLDDSEPLHRAYSQMAVCNSLKSSPPEGQRCSKKVSSSATAARFGLSAVLPALLTMRLRY